MSKLVDKKKQTKKTNPAVKATPKKDDATKPPVANAQKKPATKLEKHIADEMIVLPSKRVWPD